MKLNRRNVLIGLGAVATGGGALFGSGAFSQVEAERTVTINTAGDSAANVQIAVDPNGNFSGLTQSTSGEITIEANAINQNARTVFRDAFAVTPDGASATNGYNLDILNGYSDNGGTTLVYGSLQSPGSVQALYFVSSNTSNITAGTQVLFDIVVDFADTNSAGDETGSVVVQANRA